MKILRIVLALMISGVAARAQLRTNILGLPLSTAPSVDNSYVPFSDSRTNNSSYRTSIRSMLNAVGDNWVAQGTTNSTLPGIGIPWAIEATNHVNVGVPGDAGLISVQDTNNVPYVAMDPTNSITFGTNIFTYGPQRNAVLSGLRLTDHGDFESTGFFFEEADSLSYNADAWIDGYAYVAGTTNAHTQLDAKSVSASGQAEFGADVLSSVGTNRVLVTGLFGGKGFTLEPTVGNNSIAYTLGTYNTLTNGYLIQGMTGTTTNFLVKEVSGNDVTSGKFLAADGGYYPVTSPPGVVQTNLIINPTDLRLPARASSTNFSDSPFQVISAYTNAVGFNSTNKFINRAGASTLGVGTDALNAVTGDNANTAFGNRSLRLLTTGIGNSVFGYNSGAALVDGGQNTVVGDAALQSGVSTFDSTAVGYLALQSTTGDDNTAVGYQAGNTTTTGQQNTFIGSAAIGAANSDNNEIVIGYNTTGKGSNTATIGNSSVADLYTPGAIHLDRSATNVLSRSGSDLVYTNGSVQPYFKVQSSSGYARLGTDSLGNAVVDTGGAVFIDHTLATRAHIPFQPGYTLGQLGNAWTQVHGLVFYVSPAFNNGGTNYAYLKASLSTTNGPVEFLSAANGTAGTPKAINFSFGTDLSSSTNYVQIDANETANETGLLLRRNGSVVRVSVGAADSATAGFRVLRVPN